LLLDPFEAERSRRRGQGRAWDLAIVPERHGGEKATRILALEPLARNGWLLLAQDLPEEFMGQLLDFPTAAHDDGPDAVAAAVALARGAAPPALKTARRPRHPAGALGNY
jgi:predicted phage terminase large subunit-like protein